ncbi:AzlD domain-containing protein [Rhodoluna lacicola]|uniref:Branched-chain amino acid transport protein (AzlD) n=1 Tax=Rhodoluna lacicola TaxID=529884 RepID=A0A060JC43_9MICO|nr:AzlD domain-containing protein [Rhodoluna lacicola]AIC47446.1 Branched-chain amino acid transport protein (AzlD) [Rhodoluna lacicola]
MTLWLGILIASAAVYSWKLLGFLVPSSVLNNPKISRIANLLTVALLAALLGVQGLTGSGEIQFDARIPALGLAAVLLYLRAPFVVMVAASAALAALIRLFFGG